VIDLELCPFAKPVWLQNCIHYQVSSAYSDESLLMELYWECSRLSKTPDIETTLLIIPNHLNQFSDFNQFLNLAEEWLDQNNWSGVYQLAHFHPHYQFSGTSYEDRENWTNRSPFPILHLLRETSLSKAVVNHPSVAEIPETNINQLKNLGDEAFSRIFTNIECKS